MGIENLLHFEGTQSERSCSKFMFWAGSGINPCQHQHDSMSVSPNAKQKKLGISQPLFPLLFDTAQHNQVSHRALQAEQKELFIICVINPFLISKLISTHVNYSKEIPITSVMPISGLLLLGNLVPSCWCPVQRLCGGGRIQEASSCSNYKKICQLTESLLPGLS